jgi:hypothetical protein
MSTDSEVKYRKRRRLEMYEQEREARNYTTIVENELNYGQEAEDEWSDRQTGQVPFSLSQAYEPATVVISSCPGMKTSDAKQEGTYCQTFFMESMATHS